MAFLHPNYFPAGCVEETDSDPADIRLGGFQFYPVGVSLEQAMAWIWKSRAFTGSGSSKFLTDCCGPTGNPIYKSFSFPNSQSTSGLDAAKTKMTELICPTSYVADFVFSGTVIVQDCIDPPFTLEAECSFGFTINDPNIVIIGPTPIYLYDDEYYIAISYGVGAGFNLDEDVGRTIQVGDLTIDGVVFPLYSTPDGDCPGKVVEPTVANFSCTTTLEREAD